MERILANVTYWSMLRICGSRGQFSNVAIAMADGHGSRCSMLEFGYVGARLGKKKFFFAYQLHFVAIVNVGHGRRSFNLLRLAVVNNNVNNNICVNTDVHGFEFENETIVLSRIVFL